MLDLTRRARYLSVSAVVKVKTSSTSSISPKGTEAVLGGALGRLPIYLPTCWRHGVGGTGLTFVCITPGLGKGIRGASPEPDSADSISIKSSPPVM